MDDDGYQACRAYRVWQLDCDCGFVCTYTEDDHPDACEKCGATVHED